MGPRWVQDYARGQIFCRKQRKALLFSYKECLDRLSHFRGPYQCPPGASTIHERGIKRLRVSVISSFARRICRVVLVSGTPLPTKISFRLQLLIVPSALVYFGTLCLSGSFLRRLPTCDFACGLGQRFGSRFWLPVTSLQP